jgi:hypothetical protein
VQEALGSSRVLQDIFIMLQRYFKVCTRASQWCFRSPSRCIIIVKGCCLLIVNNTNTQIKRSHTIYVKCTYTYQMDESGKRCHEFEGSSWKTLKLKRNNGSGYLTFYLEMTKVLLSYIFDLSNLPVEEFRKSNMYFESSQNILELFRKPTKGYC